MLNSWLWMGFSTNWMSIYSP